VYRQINTLLGGKFITIAPIVLPGLLLAILVVVLRRGNWTAAIRLGPVACGVALLVIALFTADPAFPVKRIHVAEYLLLSLLVRLTLSRHVQGYGLLLFSTLFCGILGVHDELLQGLHPARTYGLSDMVVNFLAGSGGCLLWHGLSMFSGTAGEEGLRFGHSPARPDLIYIALHCCGVIAAAVPLIAYRHAAMPFWPFLPIAAASVFWAVYLASRRTLWWSTLAVQNLAMVLILVYPVLVDVFQIPFN
jgi:hypothetical protein